MQQSNERESNQAVIPKYPVRGLLEYQLAGNMMLTMFKAKQQDYFSEKNTINLS